MENRLKDPMPMFIPVIVGSATIIVFEWTMWRLFLRRVKGIDFPRDVDKSHLRFFTILRIRICAIAHTCFLLAALMLILLFAW